MVKVLFVVSTLTSGPRTWICLVASGIRLADSVGLTHTCTAVVLEVTAAGGVVTGTGTTVLVASKLKSSARLATVRGVMMNGLPVGSVSVIVSGELSNAVPVPL